MEYPVRLDASIFGIFVGYNGDNLPFFNGKNLFPPSEGDLGYIAVGWPALGNLRNFKSYNSYSEAYEVSYPYPEENLQTKQSYSMRKNMAWRFAFEAQVGDLIIAPCSHEDLVLVGIIIGEYEGNFHNELDLPFTLHSAGEIKSRWVDLVHTRKVKWLKIFSREDSGYSKVNRIGQLTFSKSSFTVKELLAILETTGE